MCSKVYSSSDRFCEEITVEISSFHLGAKKVIGIVMLNTGHNNSLLLQAGFHRLQKCISDKKQWDF